MNAVQRTDARVDAAYKALMANARLPFGSSKRTSTADMNTPINREFQAAYAAWMIGRPSC